MSIAFIDNWHFWGFLMILFLAAMQSIPPVLYDAAKIDGANRWQEFRHVTLPGIRPTLLFMYMMVAIWSFLAFDYIFLLDARRTGRRVRGDRHAALQERLLPL